MDLLGYLMSGCKKAHHPVEFTEARLEMYSAWTHFQKKEVLRTHKIWETTRNEAFKKSGGADEDEAEQADPVEKMLFENDNKDPVCPLQALVALDAVKTNPYKDRIFQAFSEDATGNLTFDEFLDCVCHFSPRATKQDKLKAVYRVYDFDCDGLLGKRDVAQVIKLMYGNETAKYTVDDIDFDEIADHVVDEADLDETGYLGFVEFTKIMASVLEFEGNMNIRFGAMG